ncbi:MAG: hypothetical protein N2234_00215 [Planctomycetota bacterium]|nr:hypothetical protein [Planctomycetota bacterium]
MRVVWKNRDGGQIEVVKFWFESGCGFESGGGEMVLVAENFQELKSCGDVNLIPSEGDTLKDSLVLSGLYLDSYERIEGEDGSLYKVKIVDRRVFWSYATVNLTANLQRDDGSFEEESLDGGVVFTWRRLVEELFSMLGEKVRNISSLPESPVPVFGIRWRNIRVVDALEWLLSLGGYTVAFRYDGALLVVKVGGDVVTSGEESGYIEKRVERCYLRKPEGVEFVGSTIQVWCRCETEAVALDTDGKIKPLSDVSYLKGKDVGLELSCNFASLEGQEKAQRYARASVGRLFRLKGEAPRPLLERDYHLKRAKVEGAAFLPAKKRGFKNIDGFEHSFEIIDSERGILRTDRVCGHLTKEDVDGLPCICDEEPVRVELSPPVVEYPTNKRSGERKTVLWRRRYGSDGAVLFIPVPYVRVVEDREGYNWHKFYESVVSKIAEMILSLPDSVEVCTYIYAGARCFSADGRISKVRWVFEEGVCYTETSVGSFWGKFVKLLLKNLPFGESGWRSSTVCSVLDSGEILTRYLINANKRGVIPLVSEANEEAPYETRLFGRLVSYDEEQALPELKDVLPFEERNFCARRHKVSGLVPEEEAQDKVWALRLISDDKHRIESPLNRSTPVVRLCDEREGDLDDIWRVRAVPSSGDVAEGMEQAGSPTYVPVVSSNLAHRLMWLINVGIGQEGGWLTDVPPEGLGLMSRDKTKKIAPPRHIGQIGNIVVLTDDDLICITSDKDSFVLANIRHDAHFHLDREHDGRIYFTTGSPGVRASGVKYIGEMVCDPTLANKNTELKMESGEWCPQISLGLSEYLYNIFVPCDCGG